MVEVPADKVINLFGGERELAELLDLSLVQIYRWRHPKDKGGADGRVPQRHHGRLLAEAARRGKSLTIDDLDPPDLPPLEKPGPKSKVDGQAA